MRVFISQPMTGRSETEIVSERDAIMRLAQRQYPNEMPTEIASYFGPDNRFTPTESLGLDIQMLGRADVVYFAPGWEKARGCRVEHTVAKEYNIGKAIHELVEEDLERKQ